MQTLVSGQEVAFLTPVNWHLKKLGLTGVGSMAAKDNARKGCIRRFFCSLFKETSAAWAPQILVKASINQKNYMLHY